MHPDFDKLLKGILEGDPNGLVVLLRGIVAETEALLKHRFSLTISDGMERIMFMDPLPFDDYISMLELADVVLDTPHFSGGSSSVEALAVGAPVVTLPSGYLKGRLTCAWYRRLGIEECIASDADDYIRIALKIGTDPKLRDELSRRIQEAAGRLFDDEVAVKELEDFFERVVIR
jgi:predicted O-linked N-acetylglucosamine transferase (SPINDLY family)